MDNTLSMSFTCRNLYGQVALTICKCSAPVALDSHILFFTITRFAISNSSQLNDICHSISRRTSCTFAARPYRTVNLLLLCWNNYSVPSGHRFCNTVFLSRLRTRRTHTQFGAWGSIWCSVYDGVQNPVYKSPFRAEPCSRYRKCLGPSTDGCGDSGTRGDALLAGLANTVCHRDSDFLRRASFTSDGLEAASNHFDD